MNMLRQQHLILPGLSVLVFGIACLSGCTGYEAGPAPANTYSSIEFFSDNNCRGDLVCTIPLEAGTWNFAEQGWNDRARSLRLTHVPPFISYKITIADDANADPSYGKTVIILYGRDSARQINIQSFEKNRPYDDGLGLEVVYHPAGSRGLDGEVSFCRIEQY